MRYIIIFFCFFLLSCSSALDKTYHFSNWEQDKIEIEEDLGKEDCDILCAYMWVIRTDWGEHEEIENSDFEMEGRYEGKTYRELLKQFKKMKKIFEERK